MQKDWTKRNIPCLLCLTISAILVVKGLDGWGWFLFAALMVHRGAE